MSCYQSGYTYGKYCGNYARKGESGIEYVQRYKLLYDFYHDMYQATDDEYSFGFIEGYKEETRCSNEIFNHSGV